MPDINVYLTDKWIEEVALSHGYKTGAINYIFCDDDFILDVNRQFLNHDYFTDIITFDYSRRHTISGDIFISLDTVATNADQLGVAYQDELHRVIIHGILHLCGINDKLPGEREIMEANENRALELLETMRNV